MKDRGQTDRVITPTHAVLSRCRWPRHAARLAALAHSCPLVHFVRPDPTQPINQTSYKWKDLAPTRPNPIQPTNLTAWCNQILSNRALNALNMIL